MTSKRLKELVSIYEGIEGPDSECAFLEQEKVIALFEIAYQLAILNERQTLYLKNMEEKLCR
jgi:hypothetical protein